MSDDLFSAILPSFIPPYVILRTVILPVIILLGGILQSDTLTNVIARVKGSSMPIRKWLRKK